MGKEGEPSLRNLLFTALVLLHYTHTIINYIITLELKIYHRATTNGNVKE